MRENEDFRVVAFPSDHIRTYYPELEGTDAVRDSFTLMLESNGRKCLYSSDLAAMSEIEPIAGEADLVFVEGAHFGSGEILELKRVAIHHVIAYREAEFARMKEALAAASASA